MVRIAKPPKKYRKYFTRRNIVVYAIIAVLAYGFFIYFGHGNLNYFNSILANLKNNSFLSGGTFLQNYSQPSSGVQTTNVVIGQKSYTGELCTAYFPWQVPPECKKNDYTIVDTNSSLYWICRIMVQYKYTNLTLGNTTYYHLDNFCFYFSRSSNLLQNNYP